MKIKFTNSLFRQRKKLLKFIMRTFIFLLCSTAFGFTSSDIFSQNTKIHINKDQVVSIDAVFDLLRNQTEYTFIYEENLFKDTPKVQLKKGIIRANKLLETCFSGKDFELTIKGNSIVIIAAETTKAIQQTFTVSGVVLDADGQQLPGANIVEKGTTNGTLTDFDGNFSMSVANENAILVVSYLGFATAEVNLDGQSSITIYLTESTSGLDEVVVIGYGVQKKANLTGSIQVLNNQKLEKRPVANVSQMLQGQIAGASFTPSGSGMQPGAELGLTIRGMGSLNGGSPYVLIDGIAGNLNSLNPNDIESISILKDAASAAIYGAKAAYGVVLVTTKSGHNNQETSVSANFNYSITSPTTLPETLDSYTFARAMNEAGNNFGGVMLTNDNIDRIIGYQNGELTEGTLPDPQSPTKWADYQGAHANNNWYDLWYDHGSLQQGNVSVKGGGKKTNYYLSAGYIKENGSLNFVTDNYKRYNLAATISTHLTDWWSLTYRNRYSQTDRKRPNMWNDQNYDVLFHQIARIWPTFPLKTPNDYYSYRSQIPWADSGYDIDENNIMSNMFATKLTPLKGLSINVDYTYKFFDRLFNQEERTTYLDYVDGTLFPTPLTYPNELQTTHESNRYSTGNIYATYDVSLDKVHQFSITGGLQWDNAHDRSMTGSRKDIITQEVFSLSTATGNYSVDDALAHESTISYFGRLTYNYKEKYLFEFNSRSDGTSKFAEGNRWGFFPSLSAGWNVSNEKFWNSDYTKINNFKLRGSWGRLGNQNVSAYQDMALLDIGNNLGWITNGERPVYVGSPSLTSSGLTWEVVETIDVGFDFGAIKNRLTGTFDWFQRKTFDMLGPAEALPAVIGASIPRENNSTLRTNGWEVSLGWKDFIGSEFSYNLDLILSDYSMEVTDFSNPTGILNTWYKGRKVGEIWGFDTEGLIQEDMYDSNKKGYFINGDFVDQTQIYGEWNKGDVAYKDLNGDGLITNGTNTLENHGDLRIIGNDQPRYQWGINFSASYKNISLSTFWQGVGKRDIWFSGNTNFFWGFRSWAQTTLFKDHMDYYRDTEATKYAGLGVNTNAYFPRPYLSDGNQSLKNKWASSRYLQNAAYGRMKNITLSYKIPQNIAGILKLSDVNIYLSGENLITISKLPAAFDPETVALGPWGQGKSHIPQKSISFGIEVEF